MATAAGAGSAQSQEPGGRGTWTMIALAAALIGSRIRTTWPQASSSMHHVSAAIWVLTFCAFNTGPPNYFLQQPFEGTLHIINSKKL